MKFFFAIADPIQHSLVYFEELLKRTGQVTFDFEQHNEEKWEARGRHRENFIIFIQPIKHQPIEHRA